MAPNRTWRVVLCITNETYQIQMRMTIKCIMNFMLRIHMACFLNHKNKNP